MSPRQCAARSTSRIAIAPPAQRAPRPRGRVRRPDHAPDTRHDKHGPDGQDVGCGAEIVRLDERGHLDTVTSSDRHQCLALRHRVQHAVYGGHDQLLADRQQIGISQGIGGHNRLDADAVLGRDSPQRLAVGHHVRVHDRPPHALDLGWGGLGRRCRSSRGWTRRLVARSSRRRGRSQTPGSLSRRVAATQAAERPGRAATTRAPNRSKPATARGHRAERI